MLSTRGVVREIYICGYLLTRDWSLVIVNRDTLSHTSVGVATVRRPRGIEVPKFYVISTMLYEAKSASLIERARSANDGLLLQQVINLERARLRAGMCWLCE